MPRTYIVGATSTRRRRWRRLRAVATLVAVVVLALSGSALLATRLAAPAAVGLAATASPAVTGAVAGTAAPQATSDDGIAGSAALEPAPLHGVAPPGRCVNTSDGVTLATVVHHGPRTTKVVALTFDDGWNKTNVLNILAILRRSKVNATFFPTGQAIKKSPSAWQAVAAAGFPIANHTYDHSDLKGRCETSQLADLVRHDAVLRGLGITLAPYMRPPYGDYDMETRLAAASDGEQALVLWDVDTRDWTGLSPRAIAAQALAGAEGSIIIMHTAETNTVSALPRIIAKYRARGFQFVTIGQLLGIGGPTPFP